VLAGGSAAAALAGRWPFRRRALVAAGIAGVGYLGLFLALLFTGGSPGEGPRIEGRDQIRKWLADLRSFPPEDGRRAGALEGLAGPRPDARGARPGPPPPPAGPRPLRPLPRPRLPPAPGRIGP